MSHDSTLDMGKFNPKKADLVKMAKDYKDLTIKDLDDKEGYKAVDVARKTLMKQRTTIKKCGKELRQGARDFAAEVIEREREMIEIIEPVEANLMLQKLRFDNMPKLDGRMEQVKEFNLSLTEDELLEMKDAEFKKVIDAEKLALFEKKQAEERREQDLERAREEVRKEQEEADAKAAVEEAHKEIIAEADAKAEKRAEMAGAVTTPTDTKQALKQWLVSVGYNKKTDKVIRAEDGVVRVYRLVGEYKN